MKNSQITDALFREAVSAIDAGETIKLEQLLVANPGLACERLDVAGDWLREKVGDALDGFFSKPYLLWFVAEDPIRNSNLPENIAEVTSVIIRAAKRCKTDS